MKRENLHKLLLHKHPSQKQEIDERVATLPDEVPDAHVHLNYFRAKDPSLVYSSRKFYDVVFK